jgi:hypothetical protein
LKTLMKKKQKDNKNNKKHAYPQACVCQAEMWTEAGKHPLAVKPLHPAAPKAPVALAAPGLRPLA